MSEDQRNWPNPGADPATGEPALDPSGARRETVGRILRRAREREGLNLHDVAEALRIRYDYLDAIERSDFDRLPGATYAIGFVRSYANSLNLDDQEIVRRFKDEVAGIDKTQDLHFPEPVNEGKVPGGALLLISLILIGAAYGGWIYLTDPGDSISDMVPPVPERLQALLDGGEATSNPADANASDAGTSTSASDFAPDNSETTVEAPSADNAGSAGDRTSEGTTQVAQTDTGAPETQTTETEATDPQASESQSTESQSTEPQSSETGAPESQATDESATADTSGSASSSSAQSSNETVTETEVGTVTAQAPDTSAPGTSESETSSAASGAETAPEAPDSETRPDPAETQSAQVSDQPTSSETPETGTASDTARAADRADAGSSLPDVPEVPETEAASTETGSDAPASVPEPPETGGTADTGDAATESASQQAALPDETANADDTDTQAADAAQAPLLAEAERVFGQGNAGSRVLLRATQDSWVQVRGPDNSLLLTRVLNPGDVYRVPDEPGLVLHTGNAGGLSIYVDGRQVGSLGGSGDVRRDVSLEPANLR